MNNVTNNISLVYVSSCSNTGSIRDDFYWVAGHFAERHFAERHLAERHFAERTFCRTDSMTSGLFAEKTFCRK